MSVTRNLVHIDLNTSTGGLQVFPGDGAYEANKGSAGAEGDAYVNTTLSVLRIYLDGDWRSLATADDSQQILINQVFG